MTPFEQLRRSGLSVLIFFMGVFLGKVLELRRQQQFVTKLTTEEVRDVMSRSTILHIGGQHRGGTTVPWEGLQQHPDVSSFTTVAPAEVSVFACVRACVRVPWPQGTRRQLQSPPAKPMMPHASSQKITCKRRPSYSTPYSMLVIAALNVY